jgi:hypothetical protein
MYLKAKYEQGKGYGVSGVVDAVHDQVRYVLNVESPLTEPLHGYLFRCG